MTIQAAQRRIARITLGALLSVQGDEKLGVAREPTDDTDEIGFTLTVLPDSDVIVTLLDTCDLRIVFNRCREIAAAVLDNGDDLITFTRDQTAATRRLDLFARQDPRHRRRLTASAAGQDLYYVLDLDAAKQDVITAQRSRSKITVYELLSERTTALLGPARQRIERSEPAGFRVTYIPNGEVIVTLLDTCDLCEVLLNCREIVGQLLEWDNDTVTFTRNPTEATERLADFSAPIRSRS
jgi:hypothetical protein